MPAAPHELFEKDSNEHKVFINILFLATRPKFKYSEKYLIEIKV